MNSRTLRIGTRASALARWQADHVAALLRAADPSVQIQIVILSTQGDRELDKPLPQMGSKGVFTAELESALRDGRIDLAVHSLKDLPTENPPGLCIAAIPPRADVRDALVSRDKLNLSQLPPRAIVGTSSLRRSSQLLRLRPDLQLADLRGNIDTRIAKVLDQGQYDAIVLACAGLDRLKMQELITERLAVDQIVPAPGQGALAVQSRQADAADPLLAALNDLPTARCTAAERAFLSALGGGCAVPVAAYATIANDLMTFHGRINAADGSAQVDVRLDRIISAAADISRLATDAATAATNLGAGAMLVVSSSPKSQ
jgi:hydroxymethylbilane synthase